MKKERTCFNCEHFRLCYLRRGIDKAMQWANINIDSNDAPGKYLDIFATLANMCLDFKFKKEE